MSVAVARQEHTGVQLPGQPDGPFERRRGIAGGADDQDRRRALRRQFLREGTLLDRPIRRRRFQPRRNSARTPARSFSKRGMSFFTVGDGTETPDDRYN